MLDRQQELAHQDVNNLQIQIAEMENREESALSALDLTRQQLSERDEYLQILTDEIKSKTTEIEQKQRTLFEYEERLRMCYDTIRKLEARAKSADLTVKSLERELSERKESIAQMETKEQSSRLALQSLQKQILEKEEQLQSMAKELGNFERQKMYASWKVEESVTHVASVEVRELHGKRKIGVQTECILDENVRLREQYHSLSCLLEEATNQAAEMNKRNEDLRRKLRVKSSEQRKLSQQFIEYQKQRISVLSQAITILRHGGDEEFYEQKVDT